MVFFSDMLDRMVGKLVIDGTRMTVLSINVLPGSKKGNIYIYMYIYNFKLLSFGEHKDHDINIKIKLSIKYALHSKMVRGVWFTFFSSKYNLFINCMNVL